MLGSLIVIFLFTLTISWFIMGMLWITCLVMKITQQINVCITRRFISGAQHSQNCMQ